MITVIDEGPFNRKIEAGDWRHSAIIYGIYQFYEYLVKKKGYNKKALFDYDEDFFYYRYEDLQDDHRYYDFVEYYFGSALHHRFIEDALEDQEEFDLKKDKEKIKEINDRMKGNSICKKVFGSQKFDGNNKEEVLAIIEKERVKLIRETYRYLREGYAKFCNENCLRSESKATCRLQGYNVDEGRKTKAISYNFNRESFVGVDSLEFDFIPFAFSRAREAIFINNAFSIGELITVNRKIQERITNTAMGFNRDAVDFRDLLFFSFEKTVPLLRFNVEIIVKETDEAYYKTLMVRKESVEFFLRLEREKYLNQIHKALKLPCRLKDGTYLNMLNILCHSVINQLHLDGTIEILLKDQMHSKGNDHGYLISQLIIMNEMIYKGGTMEHKQLKEAYAVSQAVVDQLKEEKANKIRSYRQRLTSSLVFKDYDRFIEILLQLSSYTQVKMPFVRHLLEDFEENKNVAYSFVNGLEDFEKKQGGNKNEDK